MNKIIMAILQYAAYVAGVVSAVWLLFPAALRVLLLLMLLDIVTGMIVAASKKALAVHVAWAGVGRKVVTLIVISLVFAVSKMLDPTVGGPLTVAVIGYYCYVEAVSIITNAAILGIPIPDWLKNALAGLSPDKISLKGDTGATGATDDTGAQGPQGPGGV
jgi:toxin secretion/phage lysis holin